MVTFTPEFEEAFNFVMLYEVGEFWNASDPDVVAGRIETPAQRRKVGYVNIPQDRGGEVKYGIAQRANPNISVRTLDLQLAKHVYFARYWLAAGCDQLAYPLSTIHFDGSVNHGPIQAIRFLQRAAGTSVDGVLGPQTLAAVAKQDARLLIQHISADRTRFYYTIVRDDPTQAIFLNGWLRRINEVTAFCLAALG